MATDKALSPTSMSDWDVGARTKLLGEVQWGIDFPSDHEQSGGRGPLCGSAEGTIGSALRGKNNSFGFLRLLFASLVLFDHAFPLGGFGGDPTYTWTHGQDSAGGIAVAGFFVISGYLITKSAIRTQAVTFLWHRFLRIFPGLWACLAVGALIVGPIAWASEQRPVLDYWTSSAGGPVQYVLSNALLTVNQWGIHDVFIGTPYGISSTISVFNGSLWTLAYEWHCYLVVGALALLGVMRRARPIIVLTWLGLWVLTVLQVEAPDMAARFGPWFDDLFNVRFTMIFMTGAVLAVYSKRIPLNDCFGVLSGCIWILSLVMAGYTVVGYPAMAYFVIWLAARLGPLFRRVGAVNDYSYGIYIYGFLVQQIVASADVQKYGFVVFLVVSWVGSLLFAMLSWHFVEKIWLRAKDWTPSRGFRRVRSPSKDGNKFDGLSGVVMASKD
ncbi:acyltransferase family protein [Pengzhenrongella phosphoraccumulans]|uniref:acyltransferase family protein n=1 Tax=Pengzhenrongella phosphoraccumulans TaxID=3114394 RepID=UPI003890D4AA